MIKIYHLPKETEQQKRYLKIKCFVTMLVIGSIVADWAVIALVANLVWIWSDPL